MTKPDRIAECCKEILKFSNNKKIQNDTIVKFCEKYKLKPWIIKEILNA